MNYIVSQSQRSRRIRQQTMVFQTHNIRHPHEPYVVAKPHEQITPTQYESCVSQNQPMVSSSFSSTSHRGLYCIIFAKPW
jgi:hypothetical protein